MAFFFKINLPATTLVSFNITLLTIKKFIKNECATNILLNNIINFKCTNKILNIINLNNIKLHLKTQNAMFAIIKVE